MVYENRGRGSKGETKHMQMRKGESKHMKKIREIGQVALILI